MKTRWIDRSIWVTTALLAALLVGCGESRLTSSTDGSYSTSGSSTYTVSEMRSLPAAGVQVGFIPNQLRCDIGDPGDQIRGPCRGMAVAFERILETHVERVRERTVEGAADAAMSGRRLAEANM